MVVYLLLRRKVRLRMQGGTVFFAGWFRRGNLRLEIQKCPVKCPV